MYLTNDFIYPAQLTGYVRQALADYPQNQMTLARWLPNRSVPDIEYRFNKGGTGLIDATMYRTYDAETPLGRRIGLNRVTGELPPLGRKTRLSEYDQLRLRNATSPGNQEMVNAILNDAMFNAKSVEARIELARGDALVNGSVTIAENGLQASVSFSRDPSLTVTAGTLWSTVATADPFSDIDSWVTTYRNLNGTDPGAILMSRSTVSLMRRCANVAKAVFPSAANQPTLLGPNTISDALQSFGLPPLFVYYAQVNTYASVAANVLPSNKVLLLPAPVDPDDFAGSQLGGTFWGVTAESQLPEYGISPADQPGIVVGNYHDNDPVANWNKSAAIALPVLANANLSMVATVA